MNNKIENKRWSILIYLLSAIAHAVILLAGRREYTNGKKKVNTFNKQTKAMIEEYNTMLMLQADNKPNCACSSNSECDNE